MTFGVDQTPRMRPRPPKHVTQKRDSRATPPELYQALHAEFDFTLDPCPFDDSAIAGAPLFGRDGLRGDWGGQRVFCNPPYSDIPPWLQKGPEAELAVYLLPVRSDLPWWHDYAMRAEAVRFIRGRLRFSGASGGAPFASCAVIVRGRFRDGNTLFRSMLRPERRRAACSPEGA